MGLTVLTLNPILPRGQCLAIVTEVASAGVQELQVGNPLSGYASAFLR